MEVFFIGKQVPKPPSVYVVEGGRGFWGPKAMYLFRFWRLLVSGLFMFLLFFSPSIFYPVYFLVVRIVKGQRRIPFVHSADLPPLRGLTLAMVTHDYCATSMSEQGNTYSASILLSIETEILVLYLLHQSNVKNDFKHSNKLGHAF